MELAANQYVCPDGYGVERFLEEAATAGFRQVALTRAALAEMTPARLRQAVERRDLSVTTLNSAGYFTWENPEQRKAQDTENRTLVAAAAELRAKALCVITGGAAEQPDLSTARHRIAEGLAELDALAAREGVHLGLEPIHPKDVATKGCMNTIAQARAMVAPLACTGLIIDLFHSWWDPDLGSIASDAGVHVLQVCNVTRDIRRSPALDRGMLDVRRAIEDFCGVGFNGPIEFEIFATDHEQSEVAPILEAATAWARS